MSQVIPEGWFFTNVGEVYSSTQGVQIPKNKQSIENLKGFRRYLYISDFKNNKNLKWVIDGYPNQIVQSGDLIMANTGTPGAVFRGINGVLSNNLFKIGVPKDYIDIEFSFNFFKSHLFTNHLDTYKKQTAQPHIGHKVFASTPLPLPPLAEQKVIADKLDELLAQVESTKARLDAIPAILKSFRQSVLAAAVSGKLTEEWRGNSDDLDVFDKKAKQLTEFRLNQLNELPKSWQWLRFDNVAEVASNLQSPESDPSAYHIAPNHIESGTGKLLSYTTVTEDKVTSAKNRFMKDKYFTPRFDHTYVK